MELSRCGQIFEKYSNICSVSTFKVKPLAHNLSCHLECVDAVLTSIRRKIAIENKIQFHDSDDKITVRAILFLRTPSQLSSSVDLTRWGRNITSYLPGALPQKRNPPYSLNRGQDGLQIWFEITEK
jgi:hypothetical protein